MQLDSISDLVTFVRVADARSFTTAAEQLGVTRSAAGKSVARLEARLGVRLLHRNTRRVAPTDEGLAFYARCVPILADLEEAELALTSRSQEPKGRLRIDAPVSFGRLHVAPLLHRYLEDWPELAVDVTFSDRFTDLVEEGIDLAIRIGGEDDSRLIARKLAPHRLVTCAAPPYLDRYGAPSTPQDLADHRRLVFTHGGRPSPWRFRARPDEGTGQAHSGFILHPVSGSFASSNAETLRDAALSGAGIAQLPTFLIGEDLRDGRLSPLLAGYRVDGPDIRAIYPSNRHLSPKVRRFVDLLVEIWSPDPPWEWKAG